MISRVLAARRQPDIACGLAVVVGCVLFVDLPALVKLLALLACTVLILIGGVTAGACLVGVSLSVSSMLIHVGSSEWTPLELALLVCALVVGTSIMIETVRARSLRVMTVWLQPPDLALLGTILMALAAVSLLWVADKDLRPDSLRAFRRVIVEPLVMVPAALAVMRSGNTRRFVHWLVWPAVAVAALALGQVPVQRSTVDIGGVARPIGTFTHPNNLAFYLERVIWFTPVLAVWLRPRIGRIAWALVGIALLATLATLSRGAAVALAIGVVVMFWEFVRARLRPFLALALAVAAFVFISRYVADTGDSIDTRGTIWHAAWNMIRDHPFTGVGLDQFLGQYGRRYVQPDGWPERYTSHPHNIILDFWLSLGIGGLAVLWLMIEVTWRRIRSSWHQPIWSVNRAAVAMIVAGFAHGLIDNGFFLPYLATLTWIGLTLSTSIDERIFDG